MGDHEYDYAVEAAEEAYYEHVLSELHRDHGEEIADEITTQEVIEAIVGSHEEWWPLASSAIEKAKTRLAQSENEEVVFHAARAFDGYLRNVFVLPLKAALAERFQRFMPPSFPFRENAFFRAANGVGDNAAFADYSLSVVAMTADEAARTIERIHRLLANQQGALWRQRDRAQSLAYRSHARDCAGTTRRDRCHDERH